MIVNYLEMDVDSRLLYYVILAGKLLIDVILI